MTDSTSSAFPSLSASDLEMKLVVSLGTTGFNPKLKGIKAEFVLKYVFICSKTKFKIRTKNFHGEKSYDELKFKKILNSK